MEAIETIQANLPQFIGSQTLIPHFIGKNKIHLTEGADYIRNSCDSYWLFDIILSYQNDKRLLNQHFQVWRLSKFNDSGVVVCEDGNDNLLLKQVIEFTDFPLNSITFWLVQDVCMLPTEY